MSDTHQTADSPARKGALQRRLCEALAQGQVPAPERWRYITLRQHERYYELRRVLPPGDAIRLALLEGE